MFKGGQANPYDEIVGKTTDENLTAENWELILNLCDKVVDEGEAGARNVVAAILKRLNHRNPNVQLYTLTLAESLSKNCGIEVHREIASRAFTQGLEKIITDRNTHDKVRKRTLSLIAEWTGDFEKDTTLGVMEECYENLKHKGYKFEAPQEAPPPDVDDEVRRREEEELQRVLEMSMHDKGGRGDWSQYSLASSHKAPSSSTSAAQPSSHTPAQTSAAPAAAEPAPKHTAPSQSNHPPPVYGGYVPSASPAINADTLSMPSSTTSTTQVTTSSYAAPSPTVSPAPDPSTQTSADTTPIVTRVRALYTFEPTESGELAFEKGDIIKVVDRGYENWWRGQLKGRTGIFPVNYVEPLPEPSASEIAKETEMEATVFGQVGNVDKLLTMLRQLNPDEDNLADNEEIQELYKQCMSLRPKIVKLIDKYTQKRADLVAMNESFVKARTIFDQMMEESLARHSAVYDPRAGYPQPPAQSYPHPDSRAPPDYGLQQFGWNANVYEQPGYNAYPAPPSAYPVAQDATYPPQVYPDTNPYAQRPHGLYQQPSYGPPGASVPYGQQEPQAYPTQPPQSPLQPQGQSPAVPHAQPGQLPPTYPVPHDQSSIPPVYQQPVSPQPQPQQSNLQVLSQVQPQALTQPQLQPQPQPQLPPQPQPQPQPHAELQVPPQQPDPQIQFQLQQQAQAQAEAQAQAQREGEARAAQAAAAAQAEALAAQAAQQAQAEATARAQAEAVARAQAEAAAQAQAEAERAQADAIARAQAEAAAKAQAEAEAAAREQAEAAARAQVEAVAHAQAEAEAQAAVQAQAAAQAQAVAAQQQQAAAEATAAAQHQAQAGPPYVYDPNTTYEDPNVQAWAQYYAQGGTDPTGSVYFISVPGVKEDPKPQPVRSSTQDTIQATQTQQQQQPQQQAQHVQQTQEPTAAAVGQVAGSPEEQQSLYQAPQAAVQPSIQQHAIPYVRWRDRQ